MINLEAIVARHEMQTLELKEGFNVECIETACAFANAGGGYVVIGVDNRGRPSTHELRSESLRDYENRVSTATEPSVAVDAEKVSFGGREVVVLKVMENPLKPVAYKGRCFIRKGSVNHQMTPAEIAECHLKSTGSSMDAVFVQGATRDELDMDAVHRYMQKAVAENRRAFLDDEEPWRALIKMGLVKSDTEITRAAYLLFAKDTQMRFSQAIIHAGAFKAEGAVVIDSHDARGNIQEQVDETLTFIRRNIRCAIVVTDKATHDRFWEYPLDGLREALANAVCHRDYGMPHDIQVKVFENRIVIISPGQLPFDMSLADLENPDHPSRPRNKLIAQVFYDLHLIEHYGSGVRRIRNDCDKNGIPYPVWESARGECTVKFFARTRESIAKLGIEPEKFGVPIANMEGEKVTEKIKEVAQKGAEVAQKGAEVAQKRQQVAQKLVGKGRADAIENALSVYDVIIADGKSTIDEMASKTNLANGSVKNALRLLRANGIVGRQGEDRGGKWVVLV